VSNRQKPLTGTEFSKPHRIPSTKEDYFGTFIPEDAYGSEYSGDNSRLKSEIPNLKLTPIKQAIADLAQWYQNNLEHIPYKEVEENNLSFIKTVTNSIETNTNPQGANIAP